jgi:anhydro-N-acetylmuramic acid kinase
MQGAKWVIGLMSGTSLDGVDAALVKISGFGHLTEAQLKHFVSVPFDKSVQAELLRVASGTPVSAQIISHLNFLLGALYSQAILQLCKEAEVQPNEIDLVGSHGQTIFHQSEPTLFCGRPLSSTLQIGEASVLAENTGITTISDFRPRDMAAGGKGAPLIPYVDYLLFRDLKIGRALLNIGGIANVTSLPAGARLQDVTAFDMGPGNMVMDALVRHFTGGGQKFDLNGATARRGKVLAPLLENLLALPYFQADPPKTAGREQFGEAFVSEIILQSGGASAEDVLCTAAELTVQSVAHAMTRFVLPKASIGQLVVSGGGARNLYLMDRLQAALPQLEVFQSDALGVPTAAKEAMGFAILANETFHLQAGNVPSATGAHHPVILGKVVYGNNYKRLRGAS